MALLTELNRYIDNTILKPDSSMEKIESFISDSVNGVFRTVVVPNWAVSRAVEMTDSTDTGVSVVIGFPLGYDPTEVKLKEIEYYLNLGRGVTDFDVVINISAVKSGMYDYVTRELEMLDDMIGDRVFKLIIETPLMNREEILRICDICVTIPGLDYIKTGTGFSSPTKVEDVQTIYSVAKGVKKIKVSGGVRSLKDVRSFMDVGADIFGASSGIFIMDELKDQGVL